MSRRSLRAALAVVPLAALASLASHAASALPGSSGTAFVAPSIVLLDDAWRAATGDRPLDPALLSFAQTHLSPSASGGGEGSGPIDLEAVTAEPIEGDGSPPVTRVHLLPVKSVDPESARELHRRLALLELLLGKLRDHDAADSTQEERLARSEKVLTIANAAHLELFVGHTLAYLEGQSREEKCLSYQRALGHARYLGFDAADGMPPAVQPGWEALLEGARELYVGPFADEIPANLCELRKAVTKGEVESSLRAGVDQRIRARVEGEIDATTRSLADKERQYAAALNASEIAVPTREIFQLKRAVEDTASLYAFVDADKLGFEKAPDGKPLLERLREERGKIALLRSNANPADIDGAATAARATLQRHQDLLAGVAARLREIAATPGLDWAAKDRLRVCTTIPETLTAENYPAYAGDLDACLTEVAGVYAALKDAGVSDPNQVAFVEKLAALSKAYIGYLKSL
ncbi:hypothetical protein [Sorangium sp. So ce131]|uniref:hypothetical protein n=1 Tax=Sorangium sp. So ce131 TaxID=3133282 RepID=UPI003F63ACF4